MQISLVGNVHLVAGTASTIPEVLVLLAKEGMGKRGDQDVYVREYQYFGIDEARELSERAASRAILADRRTFIVATPSMTNEAQNALLKTLEEPPAEAFFFFIVPSPSLLLPTLRSRTQILELSQNVDVGHTLVSAEKFLSATPAKRLDMLKPLLEKDEDDRRDLGAIIAFLSSIERILSARIKKSDVADGLHAVYRARTYIGDKGALAKPLPEQVAFLV